MAIIVRQDMTGTDSAKELETLGRLLSLSESPEDYEYKAFYVHFWNSDVPTAICDVIVTLEYYMTGYGWADDDWRWNYAKDDGNDWEQCVESLRHIADRLERTMKPEGE